MGNIVRWALIAIVLVWLATDPTGVQAVATLCVTVIKGGAQVLTSLTASLAKH